MALNSAYHPAIGDTPYYVMFKQDPRLPFTTLLKDLRPWYNEADMEFNPTVKTNKIYKEVKENIKKYSERFAQTTNKGRTITPLQPGDRVYLKNIPAPGISNKLQPTYKGPFRIAEVLSPIRLRIACLSTNRYYTVHLDNLRVVKEEALQKDDSNDIGEPYPSTDNHNDILVVDEDKEDMPQAMSTQNM